MAKPEEHVYDPVNERVVIAAAIADTDTRTRLVRNIAADEFLVPQHAAIWRALRVCVDRKLRYDPEVMRRLVVDEMASFDPEYLEPMEQDSELPINLDWHVETLRWDACKARILQGPLPELLKDLKDPKASPEICSTNARALLRSIEGGHGRKYIRRGEELNREYKAEIAARRAAGNFYPFGYAAMDAGKLNEGAMPGNVIVFSGLSGSGKSTFSCDFAVQQAKLGKAVLYCAWEMKISATLDVMISSMTRIALSRIVQGSNLSDDEVARINRAADWLTSHIKFMSNAFYDQKLRAAVKADRFSGRGNDRALDLLEGYIAESGCNVVIMDLWERCLADLSVDATVAALYRQQAMCQEYRFTGVIVQQMRLKDVEKRADKRPTRESIKGTGAFVEVADLVFGIHRDAQFKAVPDDTIEVICLKQRMGKANWAIQFDWDGDKSSITNGREVPYDPGLESSSQFGSDIGDIKTGTRTKNRSRDGY